ncbi:MAG: hypothetical protein P8Y67_12410 [Alphaproteobacteria bacterium]
MSLTNSKQPFEAHAPEQRLEIERLIGEVAKRHGVLIGRDDPVFMTITLNEIVLKRALQEMRVAVTAVQDEMAAGMAQHTAAAKTIGENIITAAATHVEAQLRSAATDAAKEINAALAARLAEARAAADRATAATRIAQWAAGFAVAAAIATILVVFATG